MGPPQAVSPWFRRYSLTGGRAEWFRAAERRNLWGGSDCKMGINVSGQGLPEAFESGLLTYGRLL